MIGATLGMMRVGSQWPSGCCMTSMPNLLVMLRGNLCRTTQHSTCKDCKGGRSRPRPITERCTTQIFGDFLATNQSLARSHQGQKLINRLPRNMGCTNFFPVCRKRWTPFVPRLSETIPVDPLDATLT